jgi:hypothetical protein
MKTGPAQLLVDAVRISAEIGRQQRALKRAVRNIPTPVPWDWAEPRLVPLLSGPRFDQPGESLVRVASRLGPTIEFGLDLGRVLLRVDEVVAERWETSAAQLLDHGTRNLRRRAERFTSSDLTTGVMSGHRIRLLEGRPPWASSILLDEPTLIRIFGPHDQLLAAPRTDCLLSMPIDTPAPVFAGIAIDLEDQWRSLWLDPFILESGALLWEGNLPAGEEID